MKTNGVLRSHFDRSPPCFFHQPTHKKNGATVFRSGRKKEKKDGEMEHVWELNKERERGRRRLLSHQWRTRVHFLFVQLVITLRDFWPVWTHLFLGVCQNAPCVINKLTLKWNHSLENTKCWISQWGMCGNSPPKSHPIWSDSQMRSGSIKFRVSGLKGQTRNYYWLKQGW